MRRGRDVPESFAAATDAAGSGATDRSGDSELVKRLRQGDPEAFETLVRTHSGRLLSVARRFLPNEQDAQDAVQDAFMRAFRAIDGFQERAQLRTWLHRIVVNSALMKLRERRRKHEEPIDDLLPTFVPDGHQATAPGEWSDAILERKEMASVVRDAISRLPEHYRTVLLLRDIEERDTAETAELLETTPNAVKVRLHRARQALRTLLDREFGVKAAG